MKPNDEERERTQTGPAWYSSSSRRPAKSLDPRFVKPPKRNVWWRGIVTLLLFGVLGTGVAVVVQAGMTFRYENSPKLLNTFFYVVGYPGIFVQSVVYDGKHVATDQERRESERTCIAVNSVVYTLVIMAWFLKPDENRLQQ
jgi:hypothetical protein